jgi:hypothetical protein
MSPFGQKLTLGALLGSMLLFGLSFLLFPPVSEVSASTCHDEAPMQSPESPAAPNHDCCLVGHDHVLPAQAPTVPVLQASAVITFSAVLTFPPHHQPEPSIIESGPLPDTVPLRV